MAVGEFKGWPFIVQKQNNSFDAYTSRVSDEYRILEENRRRNIQHEVYETWISTRHFLYCRGCKVIPFFNLIVGINPLKYSLIWDDLKGILYFYSQFRSVSSEVSSDLIIQVKGSRYLLHKVNSSTFLKELYRVNVC